MRSVGEPHLPPSGAHERRRPGQAHARIVAPQSCISARGCQRDGSRTQRYPCRGLPNAFDWWATKPW